MDRLKKCRFLLILAVVLAIVFAVLFFAPIVGDNKLFRLAMLAGWVSQILQAVSMYSEIRKIKISQEK